MPSPEFKNTEGKEKNDKRPLLGHSRAEFPLVGIFANPRDVLDAAYLKRVGTELGKPGVSTTVYEAKLINMSYAPVKRVAKPS